MKEKAVLLTCVAVLVAGVFIRPAAGGESGQSGGKATMKALPKAQTRGKMSVEEAIALRRSVRAFADKPLDEAQVAQLAWAAQGITDTRRRFRAAPSAGALFPLEIYLVTAEGVSHYLPAEHKVEVVSERDLRRSLARAALDQEFVAEAPLNIVITAVYERVTRKYGQRGVMYTHIEVGHAAQNVLLQAVGLGLGAVPVGAFDERAVSQILGLPRAEVPLYIISVGYGR